MLACFLHIEREFAKYPLMPLGIFKNWRKVAVTIVLVTRGMAFIAAEYYLPLYLQSVKEAYPTRSGVAWAWNGVIMHRTGRYREPI